LRLTKQPYYVIQPHEMCILKIEHSRQIEKEMSTKIETQHRA